MGRVGRLKVSVLILLLICISLNFVSASIQDYKIQIGASETNNISNEILLSVNVPLDGDTITNPLLFEISLDYINTSNVDCILSIDSVSYGPLFGIGNWNSLPNMELSSGQKNWDIICEDRTNNSKTASDSGNFDVFNFKINDLDEFYFYGDTIIGTLESQNDYILELKNGSNIQTINQDGGNFAIDSSFTSTADNYELIAKTSYYENEISSSKNFSIGSANASFRSTNIEIGENVIIDLDVDFVDFTGAYDILVDGVSIAGGFVDKTLMKEISFTPSEEKTYSIELKNYVNGKEHSFFGDNTLIVNSVGGNVDTDSPDIDLKYPSWDETIRENTIEFNYLVEDNTDIKECNLKIYNATENSAGVYETDGLIFPLSSSDKDLAEELLLEKNDEVDLKLVDFDEGDYIWEVKCSDSAGNDDWDFNYFKVDLSGTTYGSEITDSENSYTREEEVNELIDRINEFLESESDLGIEEKNTMEILKIDGDMNFYKKQLIQIDQDLKFNLKFMDEEKREKRVGEIDEEIDRIKDNIVISIKVGDTYEYSKNSIDVIVEDIISRYFSATGHNIKNSALRGIVKYNEELQSRISSRIEALQLEIEYIDETREIILVNKKLSVGNTFDASILEIIPEEISEEIIFVTDATDIGEGIWEINPNNLIDDQLTYYFYNDLPLQKIEKTETLLFDEEGTMNTNMITGFVVGIGDGLSFSFFSFFAGFLLFGYVGFFLFGKAKIELWKKDPAVMNILNIIEKTKLQLRQNEVENARENYCKMGEAYKLLPSKSKMFFFNEIKMVRLAIDKKDVLSLVIEYEKAKSNGRKDDTAQLHAKISEIYKKLPKKFQDKVYQRLIKNEIK